MSDYGCANVQIWGCADYDPGDQDLNFSTFQLSNAQRGLPGLIKRQRGCKINLHPLRTCFYR